MYPGPSLEDYRRSADSAKSYTVLCTGRLEKVRAGVQGVLALHGLEFNEIILKPNDNERYSRSNVKDYKRRVVTALLKQFPANTIKEVNFWDDRVDNIEAIESMKRGRPDIQFNLYYIKERKFCSVNKTELSRTTSLFKKLGLIQDAKFKMAVQEVVELLTQAWNDVVIGGGGGGNASHHQTELQVGLPSFKKINFPLKERHDQNKFETHFNKISHEIVNKFHLGKKQNNSRFGSIW